MNVQSGKGSSPTDAVPENDMGKAGRIPRAVVVAVGETSSSGVGVGVGGVHISDCACAMEEGGDSAT